MKRLLLFALLLATAACVDTEKNTYATLDFEGTEWDMLSATTSGHRYSSDVVTNGYSWSDATTCLASEALIDNSYGYPYIISGMIVSSYNSADIETYGDYSKDLFVYNAKSTSTTEGGGHNGSKNCLIVVGNYNEVANAHECAEIHFADGKARIVQGCYINSTTYFLNIVKNGNPFSAPMGEDDEITLSATGYNASGSKTTTVTYSFARKGSYVTNWTAWDLSALGAVVSIKFNLTGGPTTEWGMTTPKYFAIDDITVQTNE